MTDSIILKGTLGINNKIDPLRHQYNPDTGVGFLSQASDCDIDDSGMISRRLGQVEISNLDFLSVYCNGGDCFTIVNRTDDAALMQLIPDLSLIGIRSALTKGERLGFCQVGTKTYYSSNYQNGVIENGISSAWPGSTHIGLDTAKEFYSAPLGQHIANFDGHMLIANSDAIWISEKYEPGKFRLKKNYWQVKNARMIVPVLNGIWISDQYKTMFVPLGPGKHISQWGPLKRSSYPAHEWSENIELSENLTVNGNIIPGLSAVWSSDEGLCVGTEDGQLIVTTEDKLFYPAGDIGTTVVDGNNIINSVW